MKTATVTTSAGTFSVAEGGHGYPVLLLHSLGTSNRLWSGVIPRLSARYRVIAPDYLGHGQSSRPPHEASVPDHARWLVELADTLGIDSAAVVGTSFGGQIATELAAYYPDRFPVLILNGAAGWHLESQRVARLRMVSRLLDENGLPLPDAIPGGTVRPPDPGELAERREDLQRAGRWFLSSMWAIVSYDPIARLPRIKQPTLVLMGDRDYHMPTCYTLLEGLHNSSLEIIENCGHLSPYDCPAEVAGHIDQFLSTSSYPFHDDRRSASNEHK